MSRATATGWLAYFQFKGVKRIDQTMFNPFTTAIRTLKAKQAYPPKVSRVFLAAAKKNQVPAWVLDHLDAEKIKLSASR